MLTTESEMPVHFEEVKAMQIRSRVTLNTSSIKSTNPENPLLSGPNSRRKTGTPYQGQGQCQDGGGRSKQKQT